MTSDLVLIEGAARMLAEAQSLDEIRHVANIAQRAKDYARAAQLGIEAQNSAATICREAESKAGALLIEMGETGERARSGAQVNPANQYRSARRAARAPSTMADLGVTRHEAERWQAVARVPAEVRRDYYDKANAEGEEITRAGLLRYNAERPHPTGEPMALTLGKRPPSWKWIALDRAKLDDALKEHLAGGEQIPEHTLAFLKLQLPATLDMVCEALGDDVQDSITSFLREQRDSTDA